MPAYRNPGAPWLPYRIVGVLCEAVVVGLAIGGAAGGVVERFAALRQYQRNGQRFPHKPLVVLLALAGLARNGSSSLPWSVAGPVLAALIAEFAPPSRTGRTQSAAYPFTRLPVDRVWVLDREVPMDLVGPLAESDVTGRFERSVEEALRADPTPARPCRPGPAIARQAGLRTAVSVTESHQPEVREGSI